MQDDRLISSTVSEIDARVSASSEHTVPALRRVRRQLSMQLRDWDPDLVLDVVLRVVTAAHVPRWLAYELLHHHEPAMANLTLAQLEQLGEGFSEWGQVDAFACYLSGPAWREGRIEAGNIHRWAASADRWWRRAALVSTVPLNSTARGGRSDAKRTLAVCDRLVGDRDDMVVKAMSWALRELSRKEPQRVAAYIAANRGSLAPRVVREVQNKLVTGLKNPRSR